MPAIDHNGRFHAYGRCTDKGKTGALGFPIKASRQSTARRFADAMLLKLLPGWGRGQVVLTRNGKRVECWTLSRSNHVVRQRKCL